MARFSTKTDKPKDVKGALKRLFRYLFAHKLILIIVTVLSVFANIFALVGPKLSGNAIDVIAAGYGNVDFGKVYYYAGLMLIFYVFSSVMNYVVSTLMIIIGRKISNDMRREVFKKLTKLPVGYYDVNQTGDIISRVSYDIDVINMSLSTDFVQIISSLITISCSFGMMLYISPNLVITACITLPLSILYTKYMTGKTRPLFAKRSKKYGQLNGFSEEMFSGHKTIQAYAHEDGVIEDFYDINTEAADAFFDADYYGTIIGPSVGFINNLSLALVAMCGSFFYLFEMVTIGQISSFILYSRKFSGPVNEIANMYNEIMSALAAAERVFRLLDEDEETPDKEGAYELSEVSGKVDIEDVTFGYNPDHPVLRGMNLTAEPGSITAIVGATGAGKTTIINLLMRFYDVDKGRILLDGYDIRDIKRDDLRRAYTMVLQDTWVFAGTIRDNIAYAKKDATEEEIINAAKAARLHSYIMTLPKKYDTVIGEDGGNISKGQKQLITIARAMLVNSNMLILDEATSNVDTRTEKAIQKAMFTLMKGKTCFVIAHRLSTVRGADCILVVDNGGISECGTHDELISKKGRYYEMYMSQWN
ncbi:MAG: ABC transporter ATP-binding protein [Lachnospiraceae bacterium]|nr:ABC transporter ATP-binding protein [Lachnospiraceae bacterium]